MFFPLPQDFECSTLLKFVFELGYYTHTAALPRSSVNRFPGSKRERNSLRSEGRRDIKYSFLELAHMQHFCKELCFCSHFVQEQVTLSHWCTFVCESGTQMKALENSSTGGSALVVYMLQGGKPAEDVTHWRVLGVKDHTAHKHDGLPGSAFVLKIQRNGWKWLPTHLCSLLMWGGIPRNHLGQQENMTEKGRETWLGALIRSEIFNDGLILLTNVF